MNSITSTGGGKDGPLVTGGGSSSFDDHEYYDANDLIARKIVGSRSDLSRKIKSAGFPPPIKDANTMQARGRYEKRAVHAWDDARKARQTKAA